MSSRAEKGAASEGWAGAVGPPPRAAGKSDGPQTGGRHPRAERARARRTRRPAGGGPKAAGRPKADPEGAHRIARNPFERQERSATTLRGATANGGHERGAKTPPSERRPVPFTALGLSLCPSYLIIGTLWNHLEVWKIAS